MILEFEPYVGALPLSFGMSMVEVQSILGKPSFQRATLHGPPGLEVTFGELVLAFDPTDHLFHIGFDKSFPGTLFFEGVDLLRAPDVLETLVKRDGNPFVWVGFIILLNLGIRLGGYHQSADEGRTVSLFRRGRYDSKMARFVPFVQ